MGIHHSDCDHNHSHGNTHGHSHDHSHQVKTYGKAFTIGILLNIIFVLIEGSYGFKINSLALIADAGHNLSDVAGLILAWAGMIAANKKTNSKHSYGWKKSLCLCSIHQCDFFIDRHGFTGLGSRSQI